jgi:hypothetical protein
MATSRPFPATTRDVPFWTTRGSAWPNRWRLATMASRFSSGWSRALAGSRTTDAVVTRRTCSVGTDMETPPDWSRHRKDLEVVRDAAPWR